MGLPQSFTLQHLLYVPGRDLAEWIPVVAGRQYGVVAQTGGAMLDTTVVWNENSTSTAHVKLERWCLDNPNPGGAVCAPAWMSGTWTQEFGSPAPALAVVGKN